MQAESHSPRRRASNSFGLSTSLISGLFGVTRLTMIDKISRSHVAPVYLLRNRLGAQLRTLIELYLASPHGTYHSVVLIFVPGRQCATPNKHLQLSHILVKEICKVKLVWKNEGFIARLTSFPGTHHVKSSQVSWYLKYLVPASLGNLNFECMEKKIWAINVEFNCAAHVLYSFTVLGARICEQRLFSLSLFSLPSC